MTSTSPVLGGGTTVREVLGQGPAAAKRLKELGIDTCCGGDLTLAQVARIRGAPVEELIHALSPPAEPPTPAGGHPLGPERTIREVLEAWPHLHAVFERHGLGGCGGRRGPLERIDEFARMHRVDLPRLMGELAAARDRLPGQDAAAPVPRSVDSPIFPPFLVAGLVATVTLGAGLGTYNLLAIQRAVGPFDPASSRLHASFQIYGFVLLFVVGVAYHVVPRFLGRPLAAPGVARASLGPILGGLLLLLAGALLQGSPTFALAAAGMASIALGTLAFAGVLAATWWSARVVVEPFHPWLMGATAWWVVAVTISAAGAGLAWSRETLDPVLSSNEAAYWAALLGGATGWIQGVLLRTGPGFLGLGAPHPMALRAAFGMSQLGCLLAVAGALDLGPGARWILRDVGLVISAAGLATFIFGARLFSRERPITASNAGAFSRAMRLACIGGLLFAVLAGGFGFAELAGARPPMALFDAGRHALTLGFVTLSIFGMAGRIVPIFVGTRLRFPMAWELGVATIFLALLARICQVPAALFASPSLLDLSVASGPLALAGVTAASAALLATLAAGDDEARSGATVEVAPDTRVLALIDAYPAALPVLIRAGFTPLANPVARRTLGRFATLRLACEMHGISLESLLDQLRDACSPPRGADPPLQPRCGAGGGAGMVV